MADGMNNDIEHKAVPVNGFNVVDDEKGVVEALVSVTGIVDEVKDVIHPGAYEKTLATRTPKGVWSHAWDTPVSKTLEVVELKPGDNRLPKTTRKGEPWPEKAGAVYVKTQFNLETQRGREAYSDVKFYGDEQEWSLGYKVPVGGATIDKKTGQRHIHTLDMYEYSPVLFGAMPMAATTSVKTAQQTFRHIKSILAEIERKALSDGELEEEEPTPDDDMAATFDDFDGGEEKAKAKGSLLEPFKVVSEGDRYCVVHPKTGKKECYDSKAEADARRDALNSNERTPYPSGRLSPSTEETAESKKAYSKEDREEMAKKGEAMKDGSFPIADSNDLRNAIQAFGRAKDKEKAKRHIIKRAKELGLEDELPEDWDHKKRKKRGRDDEEKELDVAEGVRVYSLDGFVEKKAAGWGVHGVDWIWDTESWADFDVKPKFVGRARTEEGIRSRRVRYPDGTETWVEEGSIEWERASGGGEPKPKARKKPSSGPPKKTRPSDRKLKKGTLVRTSNDHAPMAKVVRSGSKGGKDYTDVDPGASQPIVRIWHDGSPQGRAGQSLEPTDPNRGLAKYDDPWEGSYEIPKPSVLKKEMDDFSDAELRLFSARLKSRADDADAIYGKGKEADELRKSALAAKKVVDAEIRKRGGRKSIDDDVEYKGVSKYSRKGLTDDEKEEIDNAEDFDGNLTDEEAAEIFGMIEDAGEEKSLTVDEIDSLLEAAGDMLTDEQKTKYTDLRDALETKAVGQGRASVGKGAVGAERLRQYWLKGKGAAKIRWNTPGDWTRCYRNLRKYMGPRAKGYCNLLHKRATGMYAGDRRNPGMKKGRRLRKDDAEGLEFKAGKKKDEEAKNPEFEKLHPRAADGKFTTKGRGGKDSLGSGASGDEVELLQEALKKAGYDPGKTDGELGKKTEAAIREYQKDNGLKVDGLAGKRTLSALAGKKGEYDKDGGKNAKPLTITDDTPQKEVRRLIKEGWAGNPDDKKERLYPPGHPKHPKTKRGKKDNSMGIEYKYLDDEAEEKAHVQLTGSLEERLREVHDAVRKELGDSYSGGEAEKVHKDRKYVMIEATYEDRVIASVIGFDDSEANRAMYEINYVRGANGKITLGEPTQVDLRAVIVPRVIDTDEKTIEETLDFAEAAFGEDFAASVEHIIESTESKNIVGALNSFVDAVTSVGMNDVEYEEKDSDYDVFDDDEDDEDYDAFDDDDLDDDEEKDIEEEIEIKEMLAEMKAGGWGVYGVDWVWEGEPWPKAPGKFGGPKRTSPKNRGKGSMKPPPDGPNKKASDDTVGALSLINDEVGGGNIPMHRKISKLETGDYGKSELQVFNSLLKRGEKRGTVSKKRADKVRKELARLREGLEKSKSAEEAFDPEHKDAHDFDDDDLETKEDTLTAEELEEFKRLAVE